MMDLKDINLFVLQRINIVRRNNNEKQIKTYTAIWG